jgi:glycosyltransferase involved in cell wall biosynthesis
LRREGRTERLVLIGPPGWDEPGLRRQIQTQFEPGAVLRLPAISESLPAWYSGAAAFVFPSRQETFGLPVLEAMACGAPVVAGDIPALREVAGSAAIFSKPGDSHELSRLLLHLLTDAAARDELRHAGPSRAAAFDWRTTADATYRHLRAAARSRLDD